MKIARIVFGTLFILSALGLLALRLFAARTFESMGEIIYLYTIVPLVVINHWLWAFPEEVKTWWREGLERR